MNEHIIQKRHSDGSFERYNLTQRYKACQAKKLDHNASIVEINHPIIGQQFMHQNKLVTFTKVFKCWEAGYYLAATYVNKNDFEANICIEIINCIEPVILKSFQKFAEQFSPI